MKKTILILFLLLGFASTTYAGFWDFIFGADTPAGVSLRTFISSQVGDSPTDGDVLQTDGSKSTWVAPSSLGIGGGTGSNWQYDTNYGADVLTPTSTIPVWFKDAVYATSTIHASGNITGANLNISNWDTAHGWGDHSGVYDILGQATSTITDHTTTYNHANYDTAYGWSNHADAGYNSQAFASSTYAIAGGAFHDGFSDFVANEHLDWTGDLGAVNIHAGNYTDTNTQLSSEQVDAYVNALLKDADSVHTRITLTYDDANNAFDFVVDDMNDDVPDAGDFGAATDLDANGALNTGSVADNEIDYANVTLADFDYQTAWRVFYSNTDGDVTELALGADGTYLKSNGAAAAPTFEAPAGGGDVTQVFDCATGDCNTMTVGTSEYLTYGTGYIDANRFAGVTTVSGTEFGYLNDVSSAIQTQLNAKVATADMDTLAELNAIIVGETVASTTQVWADAYVDNNITIDLATLATTLTIVDNENTAENNAVLFTSGGALTGGNLGIESDGDLYYTPSTGKLNATTFLAGTSYAIGDATVLEAELEIIDGATVSTTQINYLSSATGVTGTNTTNLVFSTSPTLVTPALGTPSALVGTNISGTGASFTAGAVTGFTPASGSLTLAGADALTITTTAATGITLPTSGTLITNGVATLSSLTSIGTIGTGVWEATDVGVLYGGTGLSAIPAGGLLYGSASNVFSALASSTVGKVLKIDANGFPAWGDDTNTTYTGGTNLTLDGTEFNVDDVFMTKTGAKIWSATIASTSPAFIDSGLFPIPPIADGYTITHIECRVYGGTNKVIAIEDASGNSTENLTCLETVVDDDGSITNATYTASEISYIDFGSSSGTPDYVMISVFGTY